MIMALKLVIRVSPELFCPMCRTNMLYRFKEDESRIHGK